MIEGEKVRHAGSSSSRHFKLECVKKALQPIFVNSEDQENQIHNCQNWDSPPADLNHNEDCRNSNNRIQQRFIQIIRSQMIRRAAESPDKYYPQDLEKIRTNDWAVVRFIPDDSGEQVIEKIIESIDTCLKWRKKASKYKKISELAEQFERFGSCLYETLDSNVMTGQQRLTAFLDLKGVSLESVDVPTFRHFLDLMFNYFPNILQEAFVVDVSWFLRPIVFLILKVIPEHYTKNVRIVTRSELSSSYESSGVPKELGGSLAAQPLMPLDESTISLESFSRRHNIPASVVAKAKKIYKLQ